MNIAIICTDDKLWSLYAWNRVFNEHIFSEKFVCKGFWTCNNRFGTLNRGEARMWYWSVFGVRNFFTLSLFAILFQAKCFLKMLLGKYSLSAKSLCSKNNIPYFRTSTPNDKSFVKWVKENEIDVLVIMVGHILKNEILSAPRICIVNKHAALLPASKGVFPYFWSKLYGTEQGVSFHKVTEQIDEGELIFSEKISDKTILNSMISFYFFVYKNYPRMLSEALNNIATGRTVQGEKNLSPSYFGFPKKTDFEKFSNAGGSIIRLSDLFLTFKL